MREIRIYLKQRVCHAENPPLGNFSLFSSQRIGLGPRYYTIMGSIPVVVDELAVLYFRVAVKPPYRT